MSESVITEKRTGTPIKRTREQNWKQKLIVRIAKRKVIESLRRRGVKTNGILGGGDGCEIWREIETGNWSQGNQNFLLKRIRCTRVETSNLKACSFEEEKSTIITSRNGVRSAGFEKFHLRLKK